MNVACLVGPKNKTKVVARAMAQGIEAYGDRAPVARADIAATGFDCAVMYGWINRANLRRFPQFIYADLGFWCRESHYRFSVNGWSPDAYVRAGLPMERLQTFGVRVRPWHRSGKEILIMGATAKSAPEHGFAYMEWEAAAAKAALKSGKPVVYRPKPRDVNSHKLPVAGVGYDASRTIDAALDAAWCVVTHHSNAAIDALVHGVPVHSASGAAAAFSVPLASVGDPPLLEGREQFLADVAWLQWSVAEMKSGAAWAHLRERGLIK
jgi:hypothetical protein